MSCMSNNAVIPGRNYVYSLQVTNYILASGETCYMASDISYFTASLSAKTYEYIKVPDGNFVRAKQTGKVQIKCMTKIQNPLLLRYITYYCHQACAINYFPLLCE